MGEARRKQQRKDTQKDSPTSNPGRLSLVVAAALAYGASHSDIETKEDTVESKKITLPQEADTVQPQEAETTPEYSWPVEIPEGKIELTEVPLPEQDEHFGHIDVIVLETLKEMSDERFNGHSNAIPRNIKKRLEYAGYDITEGVTEPEDIMRSLTLYFAQNNVYFDARNIDENIHLERMSIVKKYMISMDLYDDVSVSDVPIYILSEEAEKLDFPIGRTTPSIIFISGSVAEEDALANGCAAEDGIHDASLHEAVHWFDFQQSSDIRSGYILTAEEHGRIELKAFMLQAMYGKCPEFAMASLMKTGGGEAYGHAAAIVKKSFQEIMIENREPFIDMKRKKLRPKAEHVPQLAFITYQRYVKGRRWR
jgi:hypothetical protein